MLLLPFLPRHSRRHLRSHRAIRSGSFDQLDFVPGNFSAKPPNNFVSRHRAAEAFQVSSPTGTDSTNDSTAPRTRWLTRIWRDLASSHNRAAWFDTVPMTA